MISSKAALSRVAALSVAVTMCTASIAVAQTPVATSPVGTTDRATPGTWPASTRLLQAARTDGDRVGTVTHAPLTVTPRQAITRQAARLRAGSATMQQTTAKRSWASRHKVLVGVFIAVGAVCILAGWAVSKIE